jgi:hypothetical protein
MVEGIQISSPYTGDEINKRTFKIERVKVFKGIS